MDTIDPEVRADIEFASRIHAAAAASAAAPTTPGGGAATARSQGAAASPPAASAGGASRVTAAQFGRLMEEVLQRSRGIARQYLLPMPSGRKKFEEPTFCPTIDPRSEVGPGRRLFRCLLVAILLPACSASTRPEKMGKGGVASFSGPQILVSKGLLSRRHYDPHPRRRWRARRGRRGSPPTRPCTAPPRKARQSGRSAAPRWTPPRSRAAPSAPRWPRRRPRRAARCAWRATSSPPAAARARQTSTATSWTLRRSEGMLMATTPPAARAPRRARRRSRGQRPWRRWSGRSRTPWCASR